MSKNPAKVPRLSPMHAIIHIGTEKTATTTIQNFVYKNRETLTDNKVGLFSGLQIPNNRRLANYCMESDLKVPVFQRLGIDTEEKLQNYQGEIRTRLENQVHRMKKEGISHVFLTSEHLHSRLLSKNSIARLKELVDPLFEKVTILAYFREQASTLISLYSTAIKVGTKTTINQFAKRCRPDNIYFNHLDSMNMWAGIFGAENLRAKLFSSKEFCGEDIRKDVLMEINTNMPLDAFDYETEDLNPGFGPIGMELGRIINTSFTETENEQGQAKLRENLVQILENYAVATNGKPHLPAAQNIYDQFNESNTLFAERYLNHKGNPFKRPTSPAGPLTQELSLSLEKLSPVLKNLIKTAADY